MNSALALAALSALLLSAQAAPHEPALAALRDGDFARAGTTLRAVIERDPSDTAAYPMLVDAVFRAGRPLEAIAFMQAMAKRRAGNPRPLWMLGRSLRRVDRLQEAEQSLEAALAADPGWLPAWEERLLVARARGRLDELLLEMRRASGRPGAPLGVLDYAIALGQKLAYRLSDAEQALARVPDSVPERSLLHAELLWERRRASECASEVTAALARAGEGGSPSLLRARLLRLRAECLLVPDRSRAIQEAQVARDASLNAGDLSGEADAARLLSGHVSSEGRPREALRLLEWSREAHEALGEKTSLAQDLQGWAILYAELYAGREPAAALARAARLTREAGDRRAQLRILSNTALFLLERHLYGEATRVSVEALALARRLEAGRSEAVIVGNLATLFRRLGDLERAAEYGANALALFRRFGDANDVAIMQIGLGEIGLAKGDFHGASSHFEQAEQALAGHQEGRRIGAILGLGRCLMALDQTAAARLRLGDALASAQQLDRPVPQTSILVELGELELKAGDAPAALERFQEALRVAAGSWEHAPSIVRAERGLGQTQRMLGQPIRALEHQRQAIGWVEALRRDVRLASLRSQYFSDKRGLYVDAVDTLHVLSAQGSAAQHAREAFRFAELARARTLLESIESPRPEATVLREERAALLSRLSRLQASLFGSVLEQPERARLKQEIFRAERRLEELDLRASALAKAPAAAAVVTADGVAPLLGADGLLLEYLVGAKHSFVLALSGNGALRLERLPGRAEIDRAVTRLRAQLAERPPLGSSAAHAALLFDAASVYHMLLGPIADEVRAARRVVVVQDGALFQLPFEALSEDSASPFLGETREIAYAASASVFATAQRAAHAAPPALDLIALGDPPGRSARASVEDDALRAAGFLDDSWSFDRLPAARREIEAIAGVFKASRVRTLLGTELREERVTAELTRGARFVHFATHALLDETEPARSGVLLASGAGADQDGILQAREIAELRIPAELVTLSACQTGLGRLVEGEGLLGLARAFQLAGVRGLVVSLWNVSDVSTAQFMSAFYAALGRGAGKSAALREARLYMLRHPNPALRHPYHWAGFVLQGGF